MLIKVLEVGLRGQVKSTEDWEVRVCRADVSGERDSRPRQQLKRSMSEAWPGSRCGRERGGESWEEVGGVGGGQRVQGPVGHRQCWESPEGVRLS